MRERIRQQIQAFFGKWRIWGTSFIIWIILLIRDKYATDILFWLGNQYGGKMEQIIKTVISLVPKDVSGWALLLLAVTVCGVLVYNAWDVSRNKKTLDSQTSYKLRTKSVIDGKEYSNAKDYAGIRIENIGNDEIHCFARLIKFTITKRRFVFKKYTGGPEIIPIDIINPRGSYLQWDDDKESAVLKNGFPRTIRLIDDKVCLLFFESPSYYIIPDQVLDGWFRIEIELLKYQDNKFTRIKTIKDTLFVLTIIRNGKIDGFHLKWDKTKKTS